MDIVNENELVKQFISITNVDEERARFYLQLASGRLDVAISNFFESDEENLQRFQNDTFDATSVNESTVMDVNETKKHNVPAKAKETSRFATLSSLQEKNIHSDEQQAFYAGGSERSGQQILGPTNNKKLVENFFKIAREHAASNTSAKTESDNKFSGLGYRLGDSSGSQTVGTPSEVESKPRNVVLKLWKSGFSVDNGNLRSYSDAANREFLDLVQKGHVPPELLQYTDKGIIDLNLEDHTDEEFVQPKYHLTPFTGEGHVLGSPTPKIIGESLIASDARQSDIGTHEETAKTMFPVDPNLPSASLQIRLVDGSRLIIRMNNNHTLSDLRTYILLARPQFASQPFYLMTTFPRNVLNDDSKTLEELGILNGTIQQKLI